jgi:GDP-L-fucose synthase
MVGSALVRALEARGGPPPLVRTRDELDLLDQGAVERFFARERPAYVFMAAARVGGIAANAARQADFLYENLMLAANVVHAAAQHGVKKLLFLGSSCIYPKLAPQPIREEALLSGPLEGTNEGYAVAKIAGLKLCEMYRRQYGLNFIAVMPTNLYGPGDDFHPENSHVVAGLLRRFHEAKVAAKPSVAIWGSGTARRDLLHVDDLAAACLLLMERYDEAAPVNVGSGGDVTIEELARLVARTVDYGGGLTFDRSRPDGTPRKLLDNARIHALGWRPGLGLEVGLAQVYRWAVAQGILG